MTDTKEVKKLKTKTFYTLALINFIVLICTYIIMPIVLNYPPYSEGNLQFQNEIEPLNHVQQYIIVFIIVTIIFTLIVNFMMKKIYSFLNKYYRHEKIDYTEIKNVRKDCLNIPYIFYISAIAIIFSIGLILNFIFKISNLVILKFSLMFFTIIALIGLLQFMFFQKNLNQINLLTYSTSTKFEKNTGIRIKFSSNLILQIIPFLAASIIIISLIGYAKTTEEKGNSIKNYYQAYLDNRTFTSVNFDDLKNELSTIPLYSDSDYYIIISPNKEHIYTSQPNITVSDFFIKYLDYFFYKTDGRIYEYYGTEQQAYMIELKDENNEKWYIGFEYITSDNELMNFYLTIIFSVSLLYIIFIYIWSRNIASNLTTISESLANVLQEDDYTTQTFLPILSNDEFGDLAYSYNKIEELTNQHLKELQNNQDILIEQERLVSLGQMVGGIAHNLKTPIFSVAGGLEGLSDLINEYDASIENPSVTPEDMHEIASDMREWIEKLRGHISYMSDVITAVKGQTVALSDNATVEFSITELFKRVDILMKHEIKNALATLEISNNVGKTELLVGNINGLVQIINNIISNALEAYGNNYKEKIIKLNANSDGRNIIISIKDYGPGISKVAQEKMFKEMVTTKGKKGTGLGMFMSYSNIRAHFNGNLTYETELGKGTTFYITLPINK